VENRERKSKNIKLSASTISDYLSCPRKVYYRIYHRELAVETEPLILGNAVHNALEKHSDNFLAAIEYINSLDIDDKIKQKASRMVSNYFKYYKDLVDDEDKIEEFINFYFEDIPIVAKIDRYNDHRIIDWKTSRRAKPNGMENDIQSIIYKKAVREKTDKDPQQILFVNLNVPAVSESAVNSRFEEYFWKEIVPYVYNGIMNDIFPATGIFNWNSPCRYCQFREACMSDISGGLNEKGK